MNITSQLSKILLHVLSAITLIVVLVIIYFYIILPIITRHDESIIVPNLIGMSIEEASRLIKQKKLRYEITDSLYTETLPPLSVAYHFPRANIRVKEGRRIYMTINRISRPTVLLPDLVDQSKANVEAILKNNELVVGKIIMTPSPFLYLVKAIKYQGKIIHAGSPVPKGSAIDLIVGDGNSDSIFPMKRLTGLSYRDALFKIQQLDLQTGEISIVDNMDTLGVALSIYKHEPNVGELIRIGDPVHLWLIPTNQYIP